MKTDDRLIFALIESFSLIQLKMLQAFIRPTHLLTPAEQLENINKLVNTATELKQNFNLETTLSKEQMQEREQRDEQRDECDRSGGQ